jgi:hypothetical protein
MSNLCVASRGPRLARADTEASAPRSGAPAAHDCAIVMMSTSWLVAAVPSSLGGRRPSRRLPICHQSTIKALHSTALARHPFTRGPRRRSQNSDDLSMELAFVSSHSMIKRPDLPMCGRGGGERREATVAVLLVSRAASRRVRSGCRSTSLCGPGESCRAAGRRPGRHGCRDAARTFARPRLNASSRTAYAASVA